MSRYERRQYFETLCGLRDQYAGRTEDDRRSAMLIDDAVIYAEAVMIAMDAGTSAADLAADAGIPTETMPAGETSAG